MRIYVVAPNSEWRHQFEVEADQLSRQLANVVVATHHIGSTAIPGIFAKPIIDILLVVDDIHRLDSPCTEMENLGYEGLGEFGIVGRRYFRKNSSSGTRTHHIHAFQVGNFEIDRHLAFRDYMIVHSEAAQAYSELKQRLAKQYPDKPEAYMDGKDPFIKEHEVKALAWKEKTDEWNR
jgi:GrpB-like predicted nucleotidyltransferase (UPF0157 family)